MIIRWTAFLLAAILATPALAQTGAASALEKFHRAIAASDRAAVASLLAADVQIFESGFVERSRDEYLSHHFEADAKFAAAVTRKVTRHSEVAAGSMVVILQETETSGSYDGQPVRLVGTETAVLRLEGGVWRIVHLHWSSRKPKA